MKLLITGGAGFIGSNLVRYFLEEHQDVEVINLDLLTYAGNLDNVAGLEEDPRYRFVHGDICDATLVGELVGDSVGSSEGDTNGIHNHITVPSSVRRMLFWDNHEDFHCDASKGY